MPVKFHFFFSDHTHHIPIVSSLEVGLNVFVYEEKKKDLNTASYRIINL